MRRALDLIHFIVKESVTESTTKFGFDLSDLICGMEDDSEMVRGGSGKMAPNVIGKNLYF